jgi:CBS domain containing-hemolysin-like protein
MFEDPWSWLVLIIILAFGGYFSLAETAFAAADPIRIKVLSEKSSLAKKTLQLIEQFDDSVIVTVIGSNITSVLLSTISTIFFINLYQDDGVGTLIATIFSALLFYIFCDTIPKVIGRGLPNQSALFSTFLFQIFKVIFFPIYFILSRIKKVLNRSTKNMVQTTMTEADFANIVEQQHVEGTLDEHEVQLIQSAIEFSDTTVKDVLTPIEKMSGLPESMLHHADLPMHLVNSPFSRVPIYRDSLQNIIGVLSIRTYFQNYQKNRQIDAISLMKKPYVVTSKVTIDDLFEGYKKFRTHVAIVKDQLGHVIGMVTMEDVLQEIVGQMEEMVKYTGIIRG